ncbi:hypothetical protein SARC_07959 [Sphaeroforma arctica JP610]|uniref:Uncharacterized protein n=1 Tax=Sphaeroforma arctica JP610 TaxID=667725 RepID=A0A0L0FUQ5_9EUKA|nr:hypothetical protein SARC_07959 [Sphaeroforma arctica JP610]KNC79658.1 hypothetical protein SARC_07959 [Sphaeroforma arctica JP610]|eukprot:XP_014153560.1 hypothetical protein SARC_07959 [Sphaeroforma arctica JP610]
MVLSVLAVSVAISATVVAPFGYNTSPHSLASTSRREVELVCTDEEKEWVYKPDNMNRDCGPTCKDVACQETNVSCGDYGEVTEERCGLIVDPKDQQSGEYDDQRCGGNCTSTTGQAEMN